MGPHTLRTSAAPCLTPRSPGLGPCTPRMSAAPCPDLWEPRAGPLPPMDTCSPLPGAPRDGPPRLAGLCSSSTSSSVGSGWLPLGPTWSRAGLGLPVPGAGSPSPSQRALHHPHHLPYPGRSLPPPASTRWRTVPPWPPPWWHRPMAWAPGPPPAALSAPRAWTCPLSPRHGLGVSPLPKDCTGPRLPRDCRHLPD